MNNVMLNESWLQVIVRKRDQSQTLGISWFTTSHLNLVNFIRKLLWVR